MRITNPMITNRMLINLNKNVRRVDRLYTQIASGKKIQFASEDPIIAARALKFRSNADETVQYQKNVNQGLSWMEITEEAFSNVENVFAKIHELVTQGASDTYATDDRKKIITDIASLVKQIGMEMNVNFAGRYVFSGFRTNKPPILMEDSTNVYRIEQTFSAADAEDTFSYAKFPNLPPEIGNIKVLKLPYNNVSSLNAGPVVINTVASPQTPGAYSPNASEINYISETGELILGENVYNQLTSADILLEYTKDNIKVGEINPEVYFTCADVTDPLNIIYYNMDAHDMEYEFGIDARIPVNSLAKNVYRDKMFSDLKSFVELVSKVEISDRTSLENYLITQGLSGDALSDALEMQITKEEQSISGLLQDRFSDMLASLDNYAKIVGSERADLGSRMARLELIDSRLAESEVTYTGLLSDNEDADYMETIMRLRNAESVYQASLQMGAKIIQTSLAEFIR